MERDQVAAGKTCLRARLMEPVDSTGLAVVRIGLGFLIAWEIWREYDLGFLRADYVDPTYLFRWWAFEWVKPLPGDWFFVAFALVVVAALCVALGLFYRAAAFVQWAGITYLFLLEKARYLNHRYLACLFAFLLILVPAHAAYSLDARRKPWVRSPTIPTWSLWLFRFQVGVPYFFAGIAKLNFDWLVRVEPLSIWLAEQTDFPFIGSYFASATFVRLLAYASICVDFGVPFLMLLRRTRAVAYGAALLFHFMNARLFNIGMFPWMMILATTVFFDADWPRRLGAALRTGKPAARGLIAAGFALGFVVGGFLPTTFSAVKAIIGGIGVAVFAFHLLPAQVRSSEQTGVGTPWKRYVFARGLALFLAVWVVVQVVLPLRHFAIAGNTHWTEEGNRFAWHMLLHHKEATARFVIAGPGASAVGPFGLREHLTEHQIQKLVQHPELIHQFAHYLEEYFREIGADDIEVRVQTSVSLNGRPRQRMIDAGVDLTSIGRPYVPPEQWIVPLEDYR